MKYRIKKVTKPSGFEYYQAQVCYGLWWWVWWDVNSNGEVDYSIRYCTTRLDAETRIAAHILNNTKDKVEYFPIKIEEK